MKKRGKYDRTPYLMLCAIIRLSLLSFCDMELAESKVKAICVKTAKVSHAHVCSGKSTLAAMSP